MPASYVDNVLDFIKDHYVSYSFGVFIAIMLIVIVLYVSKTITPDTDWVITIVAVSYVGIISFSRWISTRPRYTPVQRYDKKYEGVVVP